MSVRPLPMKDLGLSLVKPDTPDLPPIPPFMAAGTRPWPGIVRLPSLEKELRLFLARQRLPSLRANSERGLLIYSRPGFGKSKSIANYLTMIAGMHVVTIASASLGATYEHEHIDRLERSLVGAERLARETEVQVALVLDDIDALISLPAGTIPTPNHEQLRVFFQHLLETPSRYVQASGLSIPVIFSANRMAGRVVHDAVFRDGRCTVIEHRVTPEEMTAIVEHHMRPLSRTDRWVVGKLRRRFADAAPAFWGALSNRLDAERIDRLLTAGAEDEAIERALARPRELSRATLVVAEQIWAARDAAFNTGK